MKSPFQVRSTQRDSETDKQRIGSIAQSIEAAIGAAQKERDVLQSRVSDARNLASIAVGNADDEHLTRETADKEILNEYERQMKVGERRIRELDRQIANLIELRDLSRRSFSDVLGSIR